jgi:uncharacterized MnhB-related membrane protein
MAIVVKSQQLRRLQAVLSMVIVLSLLALLMAPLQAIIVPSILSALSCFHFFFLEA